MPERHLSEADLVKMRAMLSNSAQNTKNYLLTELNPEQQAVQKMGLNKLLRDSLLSDRLNTELLEPANYQHLLHDIADFLLTFIMLEPNSYSLNMKSIHWEEHIVRPLDAEVTCLAYQLHGKEKVEKKKLRWLSLDYQKSIRRVWKQLNGFEETTGTFSKNFGDLSSTNVPEITDSDNKAFRDITNLGKINELSWKHKP